MWCTKGVASAIQTCQQQKSVLIILVEPVFTVLHNPHPAQESSSQMLSRLSTASMHKITFSHPVVLDIIRQSQAACLKLPNDEADADFKAFSVYFKLHGTPPNLFFVSPLSGQTLVHKKGFVSPKNFAQALISATKIVAGRDIAMPTFSAPRSSVTVLPSEEESASSQEHHTRSAERSELVEFTPSPPPSPTPPTSLKSLPAQSKSMKLPMNPRNTSEARLLARLPGGVQVRKIFPATALLSQVRSWLADEMEVSTASIVISTAFPRRTLDHGENPKMLTELGLVPSETLIVVVGGDTNDAAPDEQITLRSSVAGLRSYATGALAVVGGFLRSFVADNPSGRTEEQQQLRGEARRDGTGAQLPSALQIERNRLPRRSIDNDENLLSNGNSTQYGWNPHDESEE